MDKRRENLLCRFTVYYKEDNKPLTKAWYPTGWFVSTYLATLVGALRTRGAEIVTTLPPFTGMLRDKLKMLADGASLARSAGEEIKTISDSLQERLKERGYTDD